MGFFDKLVKKTGNQFASRLAEDELEEDITYVDTGSYSLNAALSGSIFGGIPCNKVVGLAGEESTGKTFYALSIARHFQEQNPDGAVFYFETEGAIDKTPKTRQMLQSRGVDPDRFVILPIVTIQEFRTQALKVLDDYLASPEEGRPPMMIVLDSLGNASTEKEVNDIGEGKDTKDMTRSQLIRAAFRVLTLKMNRARVPMIVINHVHDVIGSYVPTKDMGGGRGLKYAASIIGFLSKSKKKDDDNVVTGAVITVRIRKSRFTREEKYVETLLDHTHGLNRYYGLLEIAEAGGVVKKEGKQWVIPGHQKPVFEKRIYKDPEAYFTPDLLKEIDEAAKAIFLYGAGEDGEDSEADDE